MSDFWKDRAAELNARGQSQGEKREDESRRMMDYKHASAVGSTPEDIIELARTNPIVRASVDTWRTGLVSWEACLRHMVARLAEVNARLLNMIVEAESARQIEIHLTGEGAEQLREMLGRQRESAVVLKQKSEPDSTPTGDAANGFGKGVGTGFTDDEIARMRGSTGDRNE